MQTLTFKYHAKYVGMDNLDVSFDDLGAADVLRPVATATATGTRKPAPTTVSDCQCLICLDKPVDTVLYQCGHMCLCYGCGMQLKQRGAHCPVCRAPIRDIIKAYHSL